MPHPIAPAAPTPARRAHASVLRTGMIMVVRSGGNLLARLLTAPERFLVAVDTAALQRSQQLADSRAGAKRRAEKAATAATTAIAASAAANAANAAAASL